MPYSPEKRFLEEQATNAYPKDIHKLEPVQVTIL